ncbi:MAG: YitT family protein [Bacteroidales bacterium]|jgi:uncharacterized membrane protein YczE|nr:YitT family protein [Bacteroidales bacterium]
MNPKAKDILRRYAVASVGLVFVALGVALSIISNLGTAPLSCPAYVLNLHWPALSVGTFTLLVNTSMILIQLALLRKDFKAKYLMQIVASAVFGYLIDGCLWALDWLYPDSFAARLGLSVLGGVVTAFGVSIEVAADAWMLSAEMTVAAFSKVLRKPFGPVKVVMDSLMVVIAALLCLLFFRNPLGAGAFTTLGDALLARTPGIVIGLGTLLLAVLPGAMMRLTDPLVARLRGRSGKDGRTPR